VIKTTLVGHACLVTQSAETVILSDPVWFDYLWEEINVLCPKIKLEIDKIPPVDVLNISHRHQDHFDVRTLAYIARNRKKILKPDATILVPNDDILIEVIKELEFENVRIVTDFEPIKIRDVTLIPTPSLNQSSTAQDYFPEHGLIVHDGEVTVWNQVDTIVSPEIIQHIRELYGHLDFAHARFLPLLEGNFSYNKPMELPMDEYCSFLNIIRALEPRFVVPGSAAFRYRDEFTFLNQYSFPTTQEQYLQDLKAFYPDVQCESYFPGDVAHISAQEIRIEKQSSPFVRVAEDDSYKVIFKPGAEVPPIRTQTKDPKCHEEEMANIRKFIENELADRWRKSDTLAGWQHWQIAYQLEVFGQDGSEIWSVDFEQVPFVIQKGALGKISLYEGISASELHALIQGETSWDYVALCGNYRTFNNIYRVANGSFEIPPKDKSNYAFEPLMDAFPWDSEMDRNKFMKDVRRWKNKA
jgi:UDP-MurNAc hydroxylase